MRQTVFVHPRVAELAGKSKHQRLGPAVVRLHAQEDAEFLELRLQVLILPGQWLPVSGRRAGECEGRTPLIGPGEI